jgi:hypothetical protein
VHLFTPRTAILAGGPSPATPSAGRIRRRRERVLLARLSPDSAAAIKLEFLDGAGKVLQTYQRSSGAPGAGGPPAGGGGGFGPPPRARLEPKAGLNAFQWDLRAEPPTTLPGNISLFGGPTNGYRVAPGKYQVRLTVGSTVLTQPFDVRSDPRLNTPAAEVAARDRWRGRSMPAWPRSTMRC